MYCECGCGKQTTIAARTNTKYGRIKGQFNRFFVGHNHWKGQSRSTKILKTYEIDPDTGCNPEHMEPVSFEENSKRKNGTVQCLSLSFIVIRAMNEWKKYTRSLELQMT